MARRLGRHKATISR
nr:hypothetical protein [Lactiplantibacillus plantarum]